MIPTLSKFILVAGLGIFAASSSLASDIFTYQGKLTNAASTPLADGQYRIGVRIWDVASGGDKPLWARKYDVPVVGGVFSLMIGAEGLPWGTVGAADGPLTASLKLAVSGTSRFLEITVMSDANEPEKAAGQWQVLAPRQELGMVPYAMNGVPSGTVVPFAGTTIPDGWMRCDGSLLDGDDPRYAPLRSAIQTTYGAGSGKSFRLPDLRGRAVIGIGQGDTWGGSGGATNWTLATKFGAEKHQMTVAEMPNHSHIVDDPGHAHIHHGYKRFKDGESGKDAQSRDYIPSDPADYGGDKAQTGITVRSSGGGEAHNNMQPSLVLNYMIKL